MYEIWKTRGDGISPAGAWNTYGFRGNDERVIEMSTANMHWLTLTISRSQAYLSGGKYPLIRRETIKQAAAAGFCQGLHAASP